MAILGGYETQHEIYRHGLGWLATARHAGAHDAQANFVVKVFQPAFDIGGPEAMDRAVRMFLERARLQQDLVSAGAKHWAPVYEFGPARQGAYYATQHYPRSAQKLIAGRVKITPQVLHAILCGVLGGLLEIKHQTGRTHGELKPSNIFFSGTGEIDPSTVVLSDPGPAEAMTAARREAADIRALGELIYQLVLHRPFRSANWPVAPSAEWSRLGSRGKAWRELCNRLLDPNPPEPIRLEDLEPQLQRLRQRKRIVNIPLVIGVFVLLIASAGGWTWYRFSQFGDQWRQFCRMYDTWLYNFQLDVTSDPQRASRLSSLRELERPVQRIAARRIELDPKRIAGNPLLTLSALAEQPPMRIRAVYQTDQAMNVAEEITEALHPDNWPLLKLLIERQKTYEQRGWRPAEAYLRQTIDAVTPPFDGSLAQTIDHLVRSQTQLEQDLSAIEQSWQRITSNQNLIAQRGVGDAVLRQFPGFVQRYMQQAMNHPSTGPQTITELREILRPLEQLSTQLATVVRNDWSRIDHARFALESEIHTTVATAETRDFQTWLEEVRDFYIFRLTPTDEPLAGLLKLSSEAQAGIERIRTNPKEDSDAPQRLARQYDAIQSRLQALQQRAWVPRDRKTGALASAATPLRAEIEALRNAVEMRQFELTFDQNQWWQQFIARPISDSSALNAAWEAWRRQIVRPDELPVSFEEFKRRQSLAELWRSRLTEIDQLLPAPPEMDAPYGQIAIAKREQMLRDLLAAHPWSSGGPDYDKLKTDAEGRARRYAEWSNDLRQLAHDLAEASRQLDALIGLHDEGSILATLVPRWRRRDVWADLRDQTVLTSVVSWIESLEQIDAMDRATLAQLAASKDAEPLRVLSAWRRLTSLPDWPGKPQEVSADAQVHANVLPVLERIEDPFRRKQATEHWTSASLRLARFLNQVEGDGPTMQAAVKASAEALPALGRRTDADSPLGAYRALADLEGLEPRTRYNVLLGAVRVLSAGEKDDAALTQLVNAFRQEVARLPADVRQQPQVTRLLTRLDNPAGAPGPSAPWQLVSETDDTRVYKLPDVPVGELTLEFHRVVTAPGRRPVFLSATEISVAHFSWGTAAANKWNQIAPLLYAYEPQRDPRLGPRTWEWVAIGGVRQVVPTTLWLRDPSRGHPPDYPDDLKDPFHARKLTGDSATPSPLMPMQYLSAPAARQFATLMGCRLPSIAEWQAAYEQSERQVPARQWNLRDQTFIRQKQHIQRLGNDPRWPDADIFWPAGYPRQKQKQAAEAHPTTDGWLWFCEVTTESGRRFKHLVGNVAEYVAEDDQQQLIRIIGGSALSPPELDVDKPHIPDDTEAARGYSDVGLRLAFDAPAASLAQSLQWTIHEEWVTYLPPPSASTQPTAGR